MSFNLRVTGLGIIGTLVKVDDAQVILFILNDIELIPNFLYCMEIGTELSKTNETTIQGLLQNVDFPSLGQLGRQSTVQVPTKVLKHLPIERGYYERDFTAFDGNGDQWNFVMAIRQTGDYQKPFLRPPKWHEFVVAHGLSGMIMEENMG
ncbi:hypothetical protein GH714_017893 [Hevea brasiliensis]|uniref:Uncharacterized protein n=1 Tax=Hevea brasiliensis TaxID=3981 RepID=A0A6A6KW30_HEVBR|nr:hypothetical protein GH714_017893 [Hevea brasiliensis]